MSNPKLQIGAEVYASEDYYGEFLGLEKSVPAGMTGVVNDHLGSPHNTYTVTWANGKQFDHVEERWLRPTGRVIFESDEAHGAAQPVDAQASSQPSVLAPSARRTQPSGGAGEEAALWGLAIFSFVRIGWKLSVINAYRRRNDSKTWRYYWYFSAAITGLLFLVWTVSAVASA